MSRASKRTRSSESATQPSAGADANTPKLSSDFVSNHHQLVLAFKTGPSLGQIPDDVLLEILSHLPTDNVEDNLWAHRRLTLVVPSKMLTRTSITRALSQTCKLMRSRCPAMAWRRVEMCSAGPTHTVTTLDAEVVDKALKANMSVLASCPHLRPLIQSVVVAHVLSR
ncbi:hypothetical protein BU15DRAFT_74772 [Melanogaster broomeanus]|nr:hypothetical protein BU15DRAFT_74772 [Melanogaster broomeanus]